MPNKLDRAFRALAAKFEGENPHVDLHNLLPCVETQVRSRLVLLGMDDDTVLKLLHLPLTININNAIYRDNIRLLTRFSNVVILNVLMLRGIPWLTGKIHEILEESEMYALSNYTIGMFPWVFMLEDRAGSPAPLTNAFIVSLFLLQRSCDEIIERVNRKNILTISDGQRRTTWFDDLLHVIKWPFYCPEEATMECWRKDNALTVQDNQNTGIYLSLYPKGQSYRGEMMLESLNNVIDRQPELKIKFRRASISKEVMTLLGVDKAPFQVDHGNHIVQSPGVEDDILKKDTWKLGPKQRDRIVDETVKRMQHSDMPPDTFMDMEQLE